MKQSLLTLCFLFLVTSTTWAAPVGSYRAIDAYCTNPDYVYSPEEQDYRNNLSGISGSCLDGNRMSAPCFEDYYVFNSDNTGRLVTVSKDLPGVECVLTTPLTISEKKPGTIDLLLGPSTSQARSSDPNVSIECSSQGQGNKLSYNYRSEGKNLLLAVPAGNKCGEFIFKLTPVTNAP